MTTKRQALRLRPRALLAGAVTLVLSTVLHAEDRTYDGTNNNTTITTWGASNTDLLRIAPAAYANGFSAPTGASRPSARTISNTVSTHPLNDVTNSRSMTDMIYAWGQFLDHDIDLTPTGTTEAFNVVVPTGDLSFDPTSLGNKTIPLNRSIYDPATGTTNARQQINVISSYIDGSVVYGSDSTRAAALRSGIGGKLATSAGNLMPFNTGLLANANDAHIVADNQLFLAGDVRANENIELTAVQTLFMREHNRIADQIATLNPTFTDDQIYQAARKVVGAEIQSITYNQFIPTLMGNNALTTYTGYKPGTNASIATEFSTAAYRFGHSLLANDVEFLNNDGTTLQPEIPLAGAFFNPPALIGPGINPILKYLVTGQAEEVDTKVVEGVRNFLFGPPGSGGLDLASLNIQRGRDHGLADYNSTRVAYGLAAVNNFSDITSDPTLQAELQSLYGNVNDIDLWVGGLAEDHLAGASLGPTYEAILADQFERLRDGDRFFYLNDPDVASLLDSLGLTDSDLSLNNIIQWNTSLTDIQANAFSADFTPVPEPTSISLLAGGCIMLLKRRRRANIA